MSEAGERRPSRAPAPGALATGDRAAVAEVALDLASEAEALWPFVTDTDRTNRLIGSEPLELEPVGKGEKTSARFVVHTRAGGFDLEYEEPPFEWEYGKSFSVVRTMRGGPARSYVYRLELARRAGGGTRATLRLAITPRYGILRPVAQWQATRIVRKMAAVVRAVDGHVHASAPSPYEQPASPPNEARIERGEAALRKDGVDPVVAARIADLLRRGADADLVRMRPFELAAGWDLDRTEVLKGFLKAVPAGLVELRWSLVCPSCLTSSQDVERLEEVSLEGHCQLCDIAFELDLDRAVEATFVPHPDVRLVPRQMFCVGGPARTPHVMAQANLAPGESRSLGVPAEAGRYRVFVRGGKLASCTAEVGAPEEVTLELGERGLSPADVVVAPSGHVILRSEIGEPVHAKLERLTYASEAATAHVVATLGEFRRLFSTDILKRGTPLKVSHVAILFSDLTGSTALYHEAGDAAAFRLVDDHFDVLRKEIEAAKGTVVKTMGDAVMAAFQDDASCLAAATSCLAAFERFRKDHRYGEKTGLKLGLFAGPCYVVSANGALDYFGQTVNVASRLQHLAESSEIVAPRETIAAAGLAGLEVVDEREVSVKGVATPIAVARLRLRK